MSAPENLLLNKLRSRKANAIFDFDWTLVKPKEGRKFPKDEHDWQYLRPSVPAVLKKYAKTHRIIIVTDQSKEWKVKMIQNVIQDLDLPITALIHFKKESKKPNPDWFLANFPKFDPTHAFYVGDAAGRPNDWADSDKRFAENLNIAFKVPEDVFPLEKTTKQVLHRIEKEVIIMIGYPGSGKSTIAKSLEPFGYYRIDGDLFKTPAKMIKEAEKHIQEQSIIFDSTGGTQKRRLEFIQFAQKHHLPVRCLWVQTSIDDAMEQNKQRAQEGGPKIPDIAFYLYRKNFEEPTKEECEIVNL